MIEVETKNKLKVYKDSLGIVEEVENRVDDIVKLISKLCKTKIDWWAWDYDAPEGTTGTFPIEELLNGNEFSVHVACRGGKHTELLDLIPVNYLWLSNEEITKDVTRIIKEWDELDKKEAEKKCEIKNKEKELEKRLAKEKKKLKKELGIV